MPLWNPRGRFHGGSPETPPGEKVGDRWAEFSSSLPQTLIDPTFPMMHDAPWKEAWDNPGDTPPARVSLRFLDQDHRHVTGSCSWTKQPRLRQNSRQKVANVVSQKQKQFSLCRLAEIREMMTKCFTGWLFKTLWLSVDCKTWFKWILEILLFYHNILWIAQHLNCLLTFMLWISDSTLMEKKTRHKSSN